MATPESRVKAQIKGFLRTLPECWFYMPVQNGMGVVGIPDIVACIRGVFVGIECKAPGKMHTVTPNQANQLNGIQAAGGLAVVACDLDTVWAYLWERGLAPKPLEDAGKRQRHVEPQAS